MNAFLRPQYKKETQKNPGREKGAAKKKAAV